MKKLLMLLFFLPIIFSSCGECQQCTIETRSGIPGMALVFTDKVCRSDFDSDEEYKSALATYKECKTKNDREK